MNAIDLIVCLALIVAVVNGWRRGFIVQICSLAGLVAGIWLASRYGAQVGAWLTLDESVAAPGGFVVVLVVVILAVAVAARLMRKLFHFAGFGLPDNLLGVAVSVLKWLLLLSVLLSVFDRFNRSYGFVERKTIETSKTYKPLMRFSTSLTPALEWVNEQIPQQQEEPKNE